MLSKEAEKIYREIRWEVISHYGNRKTVERRIKNNFENAQTKEEEKVFKEILDYLNKPRCKDCKHLFSWGSFSEHYCEFDVKKYSDRRLKDKWNKACDKFKSRRC